MKGKTSAARRERISRLSDEWTFEGAKKCWQPMTRAVQHVGVPGHQFQAGVLWDGSLVFGPVSFLHLGVLKQEMTSLGNHFLHLSVGYGRPMRFIDRTGIGNPSIVLSLDEGRLPIPNVKTLDGDLVWHERVFAHLLGRGLQEGMRPIPGDMLIVHVTFKVLNTGRARCTGHLWLHFGDTSQVQFGYKVKVGDKAAPAITHRYEAPYGMIGDKVRYILPQPAKGSLVWHDSVVAPEGITNAAEKVVEWEITLEGGEEADLGLVLPYGLVNPSVAKTLVNLDPEALHSDCVKFWKKLQNGPGQVNTPDPFFNDYLVAVAGQMAQQVANRVNSTKVWMYKTSPNQYEGYWPCNAAKALPAFDFRGLSYINRRILQSFIDTQTDDVRNMDRGIFGAEQKLQGEGYARVHGFLGNFGDWTANPLVTSHGVVMWALAVHYRITRDRSWLGKGPGSPLAAMIAAFDWVATQRRRTMREENGGRVPHWGLLPAASSHDWLAGTPIFNDAFCIYGMAEVVRLLREIRHPRAKEMARELGDYRTCLRERYKEARDKARALPLADGTAIPFVPRMPQEMDWREPDWTYSGYGLLRAGAWGALDPHDNLVQESLAVLEAGLPKGEGKPIGRGYEPPHFSPDTADRNWLDISDNAKERHYWWRHYVEYETMWPVGGHLFLEQDDLRRFFEWLFHNLVAAIHHGFRVGVESLDGVPSCAPGDAERWQIIRKMFVNERGGGDGSQQELFLLQATPREWLRPYNQMGVKGMGTVFGGKVDLFLDVAPDGNSVRVSLKLSDLAVKPKQIRMRLRSGDGRPLASAKINGHRTPVQSGDTIRLPLVTKGEYRIEGAF